LTVFHRNAVKQQSPAYGVVRDVRSNGWKFELKVFLGTALVRVLASTWRMNRVNHEALDRHRSAGHPVALVLWHGQMLPLLWTHRAEDISILISEHRDGELITRIATALGLNSVRGSTSRGGERALLGLVRVLREGRDVAITPDGPRGPARTFAAGSLIAAQRAEAHICTIAAHASRAWKLKSWDEFIIPKPFASITVAYGLPVRVNAESARAAAGMAPEFKRLLDETCLRAGEIR
jgi:lysophospholipid acyltransferase (LPLAT)-like uncharacterized protein